MIKAFSYLILFSILMACQVKQPATTDVPNGGNANFEVVLQKENATKDGIYLGDYVVNLDYDRILELDRKKIRVEGEFVIVKGFDPKGPVVQGRESDTKRISNPKITVLE